MDDELKHYGVKGMKWGVRRNPSKAFKKASKKAERLRSDSLDAKDRAEKTKMKASKAQAKYDKATYRTNRESWLAPSSKRLDKLERKAASTAVKASQEKYNQVIAKQKSRNWEKSMAGVFKDVKASDLSPDAIDYGKRYLDMLLDR